MATDGAGRAVTDLEEPELCSSDSGCAVVDELLGETNC